MLIPIRRPHFLKHVLERWQKTPPKDARNQVAQFKTIYFLSIFFDLVRDSQCNLHKFETRLKLPESVRFLSRYLFETYKETVSITQEDGIGAEEPRMTKRFTLKMLSDLLILCLSINRYSCDLTLLVQDLAVKEGE